MTETFTMSDGTDDIDCTDPDSGYTIVPGGFRPTVAQRRENHPEIFGHVDEEVRLIVSGDTAAETNQRLQLLADLVDRAGRAWRGEVTAAVTLAFEISNSGLAGPLEVMVIGAPDEGDVLQLPADYDSATATTKIGSASDPVIWRWRRRGLWLDQEVSDANTISATQPEFAVIAEGDSDVRIPQHTNVNIDGFSSEPFEQSHFFICHNGAIRGPSDVVDDTSTGTLSTVDDAANDALNDDVIRWAAGSTTFQSIYWNNTPALTTGVRQIGIVAAVRVNNSGRVWQMKARSEIGAAGVVNSETRPVTIEYNGGEPQIVPLGSAFSAVDTHDLIRLFFRVDNASGGPTLDINYIALANMDADGATLMHIFRDQPAVAAPFDITFQHRLLSQATPAVVYDNGAGDVDTMSYDTLVAIRGALNAGSLRLCMMATNGTSWRYTNSHTIGLLHRRGHLVPQ